MTYYGTEEYTFYDYRTIDDFCNVCQKMNADITVKDVTGRFEIDAKSIVGLLTIRMGEKMHLLIEGEEEHLADSYFEKFDCTPVTIPFS